MYHQTKRVLLLMQAWVGYLEGIQQGIAQYLEQRPEWICTRVIPAPGLAIKPGTFDGVIAYVERGDVEKLVGLRIPVVNVSNWAGGVPFARVTCDDHAVGRMAGEYLMNLGLRHFAVLGPMDDRPVFSPIRQAGFVEVLAENGWKVQEPMLETARLPSGISVPQGVAVPLVAWLLGLARPTGLFVTNDHVAAEVLDTCRHADIRVPEDLCVLGVDNDELIGRFTHPPLSSIALPLTKIGFESARLLDHLMAGGEAPVGPLCFAPVGVAARQSTNLLAIDDEDVRAAVRYIREHVRQRIGVAELLEVVSVNRRYLELKFQKHLGRSPQQEIRRARMERAMQLLSQTDMPLAEIAVRSGFANPARLSNVFREQMGCTPSDYRGRFTAYGRGAGRGPDQAEGKSSSGT